MKELDLFRPFPFAVHLIVWLIYFTCSGFASIWRSGWENLPILLLLLPVSLVIAYGNRYLFKRIFIHQIRMGKLVLFNATGLLVLVSVAYLYSGGKQAWMESLIDAGRFYWHVAMLGLFLAVAEILRCFIYAWKASLLAHGREREVRIWISHFFGNITQWTMLAMLRNHDAVKYGNIGLQTGLYGLRVVESKANFFLPLDAELNALKDLMCTAPIKHLDFQVEGFTGGTMILSTVLLNLYCDMVKFGDFEEADTAYLHVIVEGKTLIIRAGNKISDEGLWSFGIGQTGLMRLRSVLLGQYREVLPILHQREGDRFLQEIRLPLRPKREHELAQASTSRGLLIKKSN